MKNYQPTRLYIKTHTETGLKYFGKSSAENIDSYYGSGKYWKRHIEEHGKEHVITEWVSDWFYEPDSIKEFALKFSKENDIVQSELWANLKDEDGLDGGGNCSEQLKLTFSNPEWIKKVGIQKYKKATESMTKTFNTEEWKNSVGTKRNKKISGTMNSEHWLNTKGKEKSRKLSEIQNDDVWKSTVGRELQKKKSETLKKIFSDTEWKATKGVEKLRKEKETKSDPEWKKRTYKTCEHCGKFCDPGNFKLHHGDNCKKKWSTV